MTAGLQGPAAQPLPVATVLGALREALADGARVVLRAPPGSGKTTRVPLALLDAPWMAGRRMVMLEPRRLAARATAAYMAHLLGERVGQTVGYRVRFDERVSAATRIEVVTEGILTRRLQDDPMLEGVGLVVFDEVHERSLQADLAMALVLDAAAELRPDLRLLAMSATLDGTRVASLLGGARLLEAAGRQHPVHVEHHPRAAREEAVDASARLVLRALAETAGDVLAFLPGIGAIRRAAARLGERLPPGTALEQLYGDLPRGEQDRVLRPDPERRRVVLATAIAETSLTIEGVTAVVDAGLARRPRFHPETGLTGLVTVPVSRAEAEQRAGRAGRLGPGRCYRAWSEHEHRRLADAAEPEIRQADLAPLVLELAAWGVTDPDALRWLDPPPAAAVAQARELLVGLGALDSAGRITAVGRRMVTLPLHPRLAHMVLAAPAEARALGCDLAALIAERDLPGAGDGADLETRLRALAAWRDRGGRGRDDGGAVARAASQLRRRAGVGAPAAGEALPVARAGALLSLAYPDRVARRRAGGAPRYRLANGRGAFLPADDPLGGAPWLVAAHVTAGEAEGRILRAAEVAPADLEALHRERLAAREVVAWDARDEAVVRERQLRLGELVLERAPLERPDPPRVVAAMLDGVRQLGLGALPWTEESRALQARILSLRAWRPQDGWPDVGDAALTATLEAWLAPWLEGCTRRAHLRRLDLAALLLAQVPWQLQPRLDEGAPTHLRVASGARRRLDYAPGAPPVLAVKLQELFGEARTPAVCWGEVPVMLHLLSPARRPVQVTRDLEGFWERTYPEVRKELKGRYPRHPWPEDPRTAVPTAAPLRRKPNQGR